jgi:cytochrome oxidase assembly protein ShyY1
MPDERSPRSPLTLTITALFLVVAFVLLGRWQLSRVYRSVDGYSAEPAAVPFATLVPAGAAVPTAAISRQVSLSGHFLATGQVVVPGHTLGGQAVSWVVTPLVTSDGTEVPVVRGWVAANDSALTTPPAGVVTVTARLEPGAVLPAGTTHAWSGYVIRTAQAPPDPLSLQPVPASPPHVTAPAQFHLQNAIYVVQWFLLAVIAIIMWWRFLRANREWEMAEHKRALEPAA